MSPLGSSVLPFILIALGLIALILSFLVPDRKKSLISLGLAGLIVVSGFWQLFSQAFRSYELNRRLRDIQHDRPMNLEEMRQKLKERTGEMPPPADAAKRPLPPDAFKKK